MAMKALLVGINDYAIKPLRGCVNDVARMRRLLSGRYGLADSNLRVLTDGAATKQAICDGLDWLAEREAGEREPVRLFHYSGHGVQLADASGDEEDALDEALVPCDFSPDDPASFLTDDDLATFYAKLGADAHVLMVMDCCHSGTNQRDLPGDLLSRSLELGDADAARLGQQVLAARARNKQHFSQAVDARLLELAQRETELPSAARLAQLREAILASVREELYGRREVPGSLVLLSACQDRQTAADAMLDGSGYNGALTYYLASALEAAPAPLSYTGLIDQIATALSNDPVLNRPGYERQIPQLECEAERAALMVLAALA